ncbi:MAG: class II fumarate hydratase [Gammaproteobacteria bacterium AqS3]|nr:class II fumarate hydratase [Gammaproteobacteria bacterium AqS3]
MADKKAYRTETDSLGPVQVPKDAHYGAQTQRAVDNFPVSGLPMPRPFISALGYIKGAAAAVNAELGLLDRGRASAIAKAAAEVAAGVHDAHFPVDVFQTGSGTSSNMNANEVIASLASKPKRLVHPNDHVNMGQSSNDTVPTAILLSAAIVLERRLLPELDHLIRSIARRTARTDVAKAVKTGRTHLMDAMPLTLKQEMDTWSAHLRQVRGHLIACRTDLHALPQGATAIGTGINAHPKFSGLIARRISKAVREAEGIRLKLQPMDSLFAGLAIPEGAVQLSSQLRALAIALLKISNDLRWMNSGPLAGLGEIEMQALQPGSSIMPGKVNPVIPESVGMVCAQVLGNDATIAFAAQSGNFQLNVMLPVIAHNLLQSLEISAGAMRILADSGIKTFKVRADSLAGALERNPILVTALNAIIGYPKAAEIAKQAYSEGRPIVDVAAERTDLSMAELRRLLDPNRLTQGGIVD